MNARGRSHAHESFPTGSGGIRVIRPEAQCFPILT